jgi:hypothetical protein
VIECFEYDRKRIGKEFLNECFLKFLKDFKGKIKRKGEKNTMQSQERKKKN